MTCLTSVPAVCLSNSSYVNEYFCTTAYFDFNSFNSTR